MFFPTAELPLPATYRFLVGAVVPRPIAWISTLSHAGVANLAPYSFFTVASCAPPVLCITQVNPRDRAAKDTLTNLQQGSDCVVNIVSADAAEVMNASCGDYPPGVSEFAVCGIESVPSQLVAAPGVALARVRFECRLRQLIEIAPQPGAGTMMLLDVVGVEADPAVLRDGAIDIALLDVIGKLGGDDYCRVSERFAIARPIIKP